MEFFLSSSSPSCPCTSSIAICFFFSSFFSLDFFFFFLFLFFLLRSPFQLHFSFTCHFHFFLSTDTFSRPRGSVKRLLHNARFYLCLFVSSLARLSGTGLSFLKCSVLKIVFFFGIISLQIVALFLLPLFISLSLFFFFWSAHSKSKLMAWDYEKKTIWKNADRKYNMGKPYRHNFQYSSASLSLSFFLSPSS